MKGYKNNIALGIIMYLCLDMNGNNTAVIKEVIPYLN